MRLVIHLGTRGCRTALSDALDGYHESLAILVPADPALLGPAMSDADLEEGLADVARIVRDRAFEHAADIAEDQARALTDVFGRKPPPAEERIDAEILDGGFVDALRAYAAGLEPAPEEAYIARDGLDVLDGVEVRPADALDPLGIELVAR